MHVREGLPDQPTRVGRIDWPKEGDNGTHLRLMSGHVVVFDRQPWRILEINEYRDHPWPLSYEQAWREHVELWRHSEHLRRANGQVNVQPPDRAEFYKRPVVLVLRNENFPRSAPKYWCAPIGHGWRVLPEHYAVCRTCGELPPCSNGEYRGEIGPRAAQSEGSALCVPAGCCIGCAEPIKPRMRTVRFPGPNLWYPDLGEGSAIFHARAACADQVECYRLQWKAEHVASPQPAAPLWSPGTAGPAGPAGATDSVLLPQTRLSPDVAKPVKGWGSADTGGTKAPDAVPVPPTPAPENASGNANANASGNGGESQAAPVAPAVSTEPAPQRPPVPQAPATGHGPAPATGHGPAPATGHGPAPATGPVLSAPVPPKPPRPAPTAPTAEDIDAVRRLTEDLNTSLAADRPAFHDAEQAARVIEELTAAVRNIALCLNGTGVRTRP